MRPHTGPSPEIWLDNLKILAAFCVVVLHVAASVVTGVQDHHSLDWWTGNLIDAAVRWTVPVFVMISGYLLLDPAKCETAAEFYRRRLNRLLIPTMFWSLFYLAWGSYRNLGDGQAIEWAPLLKKLFEGVPYYHMWYLYMLIGLYLFTPFIRKLVASLDQRELALLCALAFSLEALATLASKFYFGTRLHQDSLFINWFLLYLGYYLAGHWLGRLPPPTRYSPYTGLFIVSAAATAAGCYWLTTTQGLGQGLYFYSYQSVTVIPMALTVFMLSRGLRRTVVLSTRGARELGLCMLGVYLLHPFFLDVLQMAWGISAATYPSWIGIPLLTVAAFIFALLTSLAFRHIPVTKRLL